MVRFPGASRRRKGDPQMIDLPAGWLEQIQNVDWSRVGKAVEDYGPALDVLRHTWTRESLRDISQGKLFVPDDVINDAIAQRIGEGSNDSKVKSVKLTSHANGRLDIAAETGSGKVQKIELSGDIEEFVHKGDESYMVYRVRSRNLPGHGLMSWMFSRVSLSMAERMVGHLETPENLPVTIGHHNRVRVDYSQVLAASDFGKTTYQGHRLLDMIEIEGAKPKEGGIEFDTKLHVPDDVKKALIALLRN